MPVKYRSDHVGSLLRPPELLNARLACNDGKITDGELREIEDECVLKALSLQEEVGIEVFTEGEYRRAGWGTAFRSAIDGLVPVEGVPAVAGGLLNRWQGPNGEIANATVTSSMTSAVGRKIRQTKRIAGEEAAFLKAHAPGPWKITMPGAVSVAGQLYDPRVTTGVYTRPELIREFVEILQREVQLLVEEGCSYIQLDSLHYVERIADRTQRQRMIDNGEDPEAALDEIITADNAVLGVARRAGITVGLHMCRGNSRSAWHAEGDYEPIAEKVFNQLEVDRFLLEYDTERAGGFEPLRFVPKDKTVVLGLISSKDPNLESVDQVQRRIQAASRYLPLDNLAISPQCGFASTMFGNLLSWDDQRRKLELVVEVARKVWG